MLTKEESPSDPKINLSAALKMGINILQNWGCSDIQMEAILGIPKHSFQRYRNDSSTIDLSGDQLKRLSYITNIHIALRAVFSNPENVNGFMGMLNNNPFFNGRTPLSLIEDGKINSLSEVFRRIDGMR